MSAPPTEPKPAPVCPSQHELALAIQEFSRQVSKSSGLGILLDSWDYLYYFEAERLLTMRQALLKQTLEHFGWVDEKVYYNHGRSWEIYVHSNRHWVDWKNQFLTKLIHFAAQMKPRWREYMVSTWKPK